jgi:alcohol oxidase
MAKGDLTVASFAGAPAIRPQGQYFTIGTFIAYPYARGHVHITGPDPSDKLDFETGFLADTNNLDMKKHVWAYKKGREIARRMEVYRGELSATHPRFPAGSKAACIDTHSPLKDVKDIEYTTEDDAQIEQWVRERTSTAWHSAGTCKMGPPEEMGVVDMKLNVHGIKGLKVADLSIIPQNIGANTNNTALAIGEKAAEIFIEELGFNKG